MREGRPDVKTVETDLLIVGAGPFGLSLSAYARHLGIDHVVVGQPMSFWKDNMPSRMLLRSGADWHLDPAGGATIERFLAQTGVDGTGPISLQTYLDYCRWFQDQKGISVTPALIECLDRDGGGFRAYSDDVQFQAREVVLALGFRYFAYLPEETTRLIPEGRFGHTSEVIDFAPLRDKRVLIVGGRQSAFESAALLLEEGVAAVHVAYRHDTPRFEASDWSWVTALLDEMGDDPGWFRRLTQEQKQELNARFWAEGRLKLEPWLAPRLQSLALHLWPRSQIVACRETEAGLEIELESRARIEVDYVLFATGYKVDLVRVPLLAAGNLLPLIETRNGFPVLSERFETSVPGLFATSMMATQDFGSFFAFTVSARMSAKLIGDAVLRRGSGTSAIPS